MTVSEFTTIWEFHVKADALTQFENTYGPEGNWVQLFRRSLEYRGTVLVRDADRRGRYVTIDHWKSAEALQQFKRDHHADYAALDEKCESLTEQEVFIGDFETVV